MLLRVAFWFNIAVAALASAVRSVFTFLGRPLHSLPLQLLVARNREAAARAAFLAALEEKRRVTEAHSAAIAKVASVSAAVVKRQADHTRKMQFLSRWVRDTVPCACLSGC